MKVRIHWNPKTFSFNMTYKEQLADPRWQKKRLQIFERDKFTCQICLDTETQLHVHHNYYDKTYQTLAWEYPDNAYRTLCSDCHEGLTRYIDMFGHEKDFNVLKIKQVGQQTLVFIYYNGILKFSIDNIEVPFYLSEGNTKKVVQFLINNWLKNG